MDRGILRSFIRKYKEQFAAISSQELYKWKAVKRFQEEWNIESSDFGKMLQLALSDTKNLLASGNYFPREMITDLAHKAPQEVKFEFSKLFDEEQDILNRIESFQGGIEKLRAKYTPEAKKTYQDMRAVVAYLTLRYPERYFFYKYTMFLVLSYKIAYSYRPKSGARENLGHFLNLSELLLHEISQDQELLKLHKQRLDEGCYIDGHLHLLTQDFIYAVAKYLDVEGSSIDSMTFTPEPAPAGQLLASKESGATLSLSPRIVNFAQNEAENKRIGDLGELWVVTREQLQLEKLKLSKVKSKAVEHVSKTQGDGAGYDIRSWDVNGNEIFIEVKTTRGKLETPFYITRNELERSKIDSAKYRLYRVYNFDEETNKADLAVYHGDLSELCLNPVLFKASGLLQQSVELEHPSLGAE